MSERYVSLFSGAGGLDLGLLRAGFSPGLMCEQDKDAVATLRAFGFSSAVNQADVHDVLNSGVLGNLTAVSPASLVAGEPPVAGTATGNVGADSDAPQLMYRFMDAVGAAKPAAFIMAALPALAGGRWAAVLARLRTVARLHGYDTFVPVLDAADYGVPQHRTRCFLIGMPKGCKPDPDAAPRYPKVPAGVALHALPGNVRDAPCPSGVHPAGNPVLRNSAYLGMLLAGAGRVIDLRKVAPVIPAVLGGNKTPVLDIGQFLTGAVPWIEGYHQMLKAGGRPLDDLPPAARMVRLSLRQCAALQGLPPDYPLRGSPVSQFRQAGAVLPPGLGEAVGRSVIAGLA